MGGIFSRGKDTNSRQQIRSDEGFHTNVLTRNTPRNENYETLNRKFYQLRIHENTEQSISFNNYWASGQNRVSQHRVNPAINTSRFQVQLPQRVNIEPWKLGFYSNTSAVSVVTYTLLDVYDSEYVMVHNLIKNKHRVQVLRILKVHNPFLEASYELKKHKKGHVEEKYLFHGTKQENVDSICKYNFNWRKHGTNVGHRYGKGVSFSPNATYASNYSDENSMVKKMVIAKVMIANSCIGNEYMDVPPPGYDTTQKGEDGIVIVKYEDDEFYPAFVIIYFAQGQNKHKKRPHNPIQNQSLYLYN